MKAKASFQIAVTLKFRDQEEYSFFLSFIEEALSACGPDILGSGEWTIGQELMEQLSVENVE